MAKRFCYFIPAGQYDKKGYIPSAVFEGESGHRPMLGNGACSEPWYWGADYKTACQICDGENAKLGLSQKEVHKIIASSMRAS